MKLITLTIILLLFINFNLKAQTVIAGVVTDSVNNPIPFASVYLSNTTIGVITDKKGVYSLNIPQQGVYEMITSFMGYKSNLQIIQAEGNEQTINIKLLQDVFVLKEVTVTAKDKNRRKNYTQFIKCFLGETYNSQRCRIINPEDLHLYRDTENKVLIGYSLKPLEIENNALGYTILYDLKDFSFNYNTGITSFSGYHHFQPLTGAGKSNKTWEHNRLVAYYGSKMHFMRALFSDSLSRESYNIFESGFDTVTKEYSIIKPVLANSFRYFNNKNYVTFFYKDTLLIRYTNNRPEPATERSATPSRSIVRNLWGVAVGIQVDTPKSTINPVDSKPIEFNSFVYFSDTLRVYQNGYYYKPYSITWKGEMSNQRIADKLPDDYLPNKESNDKADAKIDKGDIPFLDSIKAGPLKVAEKVYLQLDRTIYDSGDDIWFKAYIIDASTNMPAVDITNLHVELIDPDSKIIMSRTLRINNGLGNGDFHLNDSVPSGRYRIRAYTNYMRNYDKQFFFLKEITVVNPYDEVQGLKKPVKKIENKIDITFFPEGGSLVDNVISRVAYKVVDALGKACDAEVKLYSLSGELIAGFNSTLNGMGTFSIKPIPGFNYYAVVKSKDGTEIKAELPQSFKTGVTIRTVVTPDKKLILIVSTNEATLPLLEGKDLSVTLSSRNLVTNRTDIRINSLVNNFSIPLDKMPDGIIRITLSGAEGLPLCERLVFAQKNSDVRLNISTDKISYKPREKVNAEISLAGDSIFTGAGEFSFSAAEQRFTDNSSPYPSSIASWFLLESDVRGTVEEPSYYFDPDNKKRLQDLDLLLMTQGWRDFKWKYDTLNTFEPEVGFNISGVVKRIIGNKTIPEIKIILGLFSKNTTQFHDTMTDKNGKYRFEGIDIQGTTKVLVSSTGKSERGKGLIFLDSLKYDPPDIELLNQDSVESMILAKQIPVYRQEAIVRTGMKKKYKLSDTIKVGEVVIAATRIETPQEIRIKESRRIYSSPDKELVISVASENYAGNVISYMSGRIAGVRVENDTKILLRGNEKPPLILLDGFEIDSAGLPFLTGLPMNIIDRIDVLYASPLYGMRGANGVINIITKVGVRRQPETLMPNSAYASMQGFIIPRVFYSPKYDNMTDQTLLSDYRSTIFWEPNISIERNSIAKLEYFNAGNPAKISILVEGITEEGIPVTGKVMYDVK